MCSPVAQGQDDLVTLAELAEELGRPLATVRSWPVRNAYGSPNPFPAPWRPGRRGDPNLYLREDILAWMVRTGRVRE